MAETKDQASTSELRHQAERSETLRKAIAPEAPVVARPVRRYRARMFQGGLLVVTACFGVLLYFARHAAYFNVDLTIARWLQNQHTFWLDVVMESVSELGFNPLAGVFVGVIILGAFVVGLRWEGTMLLISVLGVRGLELTIKDLVHRQRPSSDLVHVFASITGYSFPSGHVLLYVTFLGFLVFLIYTLMPASWTRTVGLSFLGVMIAAVGASRVYLGHHWPSDVVGAYLLGSLWLTLTIYAYRKGKKRFFVRQPVAPGEPSAAS